MAVRILESSDANLGSQMPSESKVASSRSTARIYAKARSGVLEQAITASESALSQGLTSAEPFGRPESFTSSASLLSRVQTPELFRTGKCVGKH